MFLNVFYYEIKKLALKQFCREYPSLRPERVNIVKIK